MFNLNDDVFINTPRTTLMLSANEGQTPRIHYYGPRLALGQGREVYDAMSLSADAYPLPEHFVLAAGRPLWGRCTPLLVPGVLAMLVPPVTERRPLCGLFASSCDCVAVY